MKPPPNPHLAANPPGLLHLEPGAEPSDSSEPSEPPDAAAARRVVRAFDEGLGAGLLHLAGRELESALDPTLDFGRRLASAYLEALCSREDDAPESPVRPDPVVLEALLPTLPPMRGAEYVSSATLESAWAEIDDEVSARREKTDGDRQEFVHALHPHWNSIGRVTFHLAERKRDEARPFGFLATFSAGLTSAGKPRHVPLGRALEQHRGDRDALLKLLRPVEAAAKQSPFARALVDSSDVYRPLAWTPDQAWRMLQAVPELQAAGVIVRLPAGARSRSARAVVTATVGDAKPSGVGVDALLGFDVSVTLGGERLTAKEQRDLLRGEAGLRLLKGRWVEVDPERLRSALERFEAVSAAADEGGLAFHEAMRLLAGARIGADDPEPDAAAGEAESWTEVRSGAWLDRLLGELRRPDEGATDALGALDDTLRPYQRVGVQWLLRIARYGLGGCLADDMGLGKTLQVIALVVALRARRFQGPHLLVVPTSLLSNWRQEVERFAPDLRLVVVHRSEQTAEELRRLSRSKLTRVDLVMTTYGTLPRTEWLAKRRWGLVVLDEAQAIKNPGTRQARAAKTLDARARVALTGTPVENRLGDLWSLFDFLCPGLLGSRRNFQEFAKELQSDSRGFAPLRRVIAPYLLRRLKTDRRVISDLPDKSEVDVWCSLTKRQAALYQESVEELARVLRDVEPKARRGVVLSFLLRFKQICNHPSQWVGDGAYDPKESGKFARLRELCEPLRERQEKALVFTQFRETVGPIARFLEGVFGAPGVSMDGSTTVKQRRQRVERFQSDGGPPFFVLSLKVGGTGLNLTAASHVVHFDRWWNPAVENQATDRAFRIGQQRNVLVHKFICRGTVEEKIDAMLADKRSLADEVVAAAGGEALLTEMPSDELIDLVSLDLRHAMTGGG